MTHDEPLRPLPRWRGRGFSLPDITALVRWIKPGAVAATMLSPRGLGTKKTKSGERQALLDTAVLSPVTPEAQEPWTSRSSGKEVLSEEAASAGLLPSALKRFWQNRTSRPGSGDRDRSPAPPFQSRDLINPPPACMPLLAATAPTTTPVPTADAHQGGSQEGPRAPVTSQRIETLCTVKSPFRSDSGLWHIHVISVRTGIHI